MLTAPGRIPTTVVTGASGSGKSRLIEQLRGQRPPGQRWALLTNSVASVPRTPSAEDPGDEYFPAGGGCACCIAGPAFRTALVRLLRAGPWEHLHIEVDPAGHSHRLVDQLRTPPFDRYLSVDRLLLTLRADDPLLRSMPSTPSALSTSSAPSASFPPATYFPVREDMLAASSRLGLASDFLLWSPAGSGLAGNLSRDASENPSEDPSENPSEDLSGIRPEDLAGWLQAAPPWPRLERVASSPDEPTGANSLFDLPGWRVFSAAPLQHAPAGFDVVRLWPAEAVSERRPLKRMLMSLAAIDAVTGFQALMRTPRAWYRWGFGRGRGGGPLCFDDGPEVVESETAWRLDNRFVLWLEPGAAEQQLREVEGLVEDLQQAMEGAADAYRSGLHAYRA